MSNLVIPFFKVLVDNKSCHGGDYDYPIIGKWTPKIKDIKICESGYHLTTDPLRWWKPKSKLYLAEGKSLVNSQVEQDKSCFEQVRLLEEVTKGWKYLKFFPILQCFLAACERSIDKKADISWANLSKANLSKANLSSANLSSANLSSAILSSADLSSAILSSADLSYDNLSYANLSKANLSKANLSKANLSKANLSKANLRNANLSSAILSYADLSSANLSYANLSYADLRNAIRYDNPPDGWKIVNNRLKKI